jgi:hypothetical protein
MTRWGGAKALELMDMNCSLSFLYPLVSYCGLWCDRTSGSEAIGLCKSSKCSNKNWSSAYNPHSKLDGRVVSYEFITFWSWILSSMSSSFYFMLVKSRMVLFLVCFSEPLSDVMKVGA